jgi:hypothetical protein
LSGRHHWRLGLNLLLGQLFGMRFCGLRLGLLLLLLRWVWPDLCKSWRHGRLLLHRLVLLLLKMLLLLHLLVLLLMQLLLVQSGRGQSGGCNEHLVREGLGGNARHHGSVLGRSYYDRVLLLRLLVLRRRLLHDYDGRVHVRRVHVDLGLLQKVNVWGSGLLLRTRLRPLLFRLLLQLLLHLWRDLLRGKVVSAHRDGLAVRVHHVDLVMRLLLRGLLRLLLRLFSWLGNIRLLLLLRWLMTDLLLRRRRLRLLLLRLLMFLVLRLLLLALFRLLLGLVLLLFLGRLFLLLLLLILGLSVLLQFLSLVLGLLLALFVACRKGFAN